MKKIVLAVEQQYDKLEIIRNIESFTLDKTRKDTLRVYTPEQALSIRFRNQIMANVANNLVSNTKEPQKKDNYVKISLSYEEFFKKVSKAQVQDSVARYNPISRLCNQVADTGGGFLLSEFNTLGLELDCLRAMKNGYSPIKNPKKNLELIVNLTLWLEEPIPAKELVWADFVSRLVLLPF